MKNTWAIQNGNWSDPNTWIGGNLPSEEQIVYAGGKTIIIDQDIKIQTIFNGSIYDIDNGGKFVIENDIIIESNVFCDTTTILEYNGNGNLTIIGNVSGGDTGYSVVITNNNTGNISVSGMIRGGNGGYSHGINNLGSGSISVTGLVGMGLGGYSYGIFNTIDGYITINGITSNLSGYYGKEPWEETI
jgi:hypothetical protein